MRDLQRVLHIEDDPSIRTLTRIALESLGGYDVLCCGSGREALEKAVQFSPDLVLMDVMMPDMDGIETMTRLRQHRTLSAVPVVFMTAKVQPAEIAQLHGLGACAVLSKPFDPLSLADRLRSIWRDSADSNTIAARKLQ